VSHWHLAFQFVKKKLYGWKGKQQKENKQTKAFKESFKMAIDGFFWVMGSYPFSFSYLYFVLF
jgi:hypothetical protein